MSGKESHLEIQKKELETWNMKRKQEIALLVLRKWKWLHLPQKYFNPFNSEFMKWTFPSLHLDTSIAAKMATIVNQEQNVK